MDERVEAVRATIGALEAAAEDRELVRALAKEERARLLKAMSLILHPDVQELRRQSRQERRERKALRRERDRARRAETGIRKLRSKDVFTTPNQGEPPAYEPVDLDGDLDGAEAQRVLIDPEACYVCKQEFTEVHHFYDQMCPSCAAYNWQKRHQTADLTGRTALLTGGRVKIGYQAGIKLLRAGAELIVTTRFPRDAAMRYAAEQDASDWSHRLHVFGLDLRHTPSVEAFCQHLLENHRRLDFIVSNACQTVRRPAEFYAHMMERETGDLARLPAEAQRLLGGYDGVRRYHLLPEGPGGDLAPTAEPIPGLTHSALLSQAELLDEDRERGRHLFPEGRLDQDLQQVDLRKQNSWRLMLAEVSSVELLETQLVNAVAPFVLNARLRRLMTSTPERDKHIVNVSAVEGQFYRKWKTSRHPHTNMAKAALNMMTRTSAVEYHADGIHMNSVDTGWVTDEDPVHIAEAKTEEHGFHPPLDIVDGAARILDPIFDGFNTGHHVWGKFLKDYRETPW